MERTEKVLRDRVRLRIERIVKQVKRDVAAAIRDEILGDLVTVKTETPPDVKATAQKKYKEWNDYIRGAQFSYHMDQEFIADIVEIIDQELSAYMRSPKDHAKWYEKYVEASKGPRINTSN